MDNVVSILDRLAGPRPTWGGAVTIKPDYRGAHRRAVAELSEFWGVDDIEVAERCERFAVALEHLAAELRATGESLQPKDPS